MRRLTHQRFVAVVALLGISACTAHAQMSTNYNAGAVPPAGFGAYNIGNTYVPQTYFQSGNGAIYSLVTKPTQVLYEANPSATLTNYNAQLTAQYGAFYNITYGGALVNNPGANNSLVVNQYAVQVNAPAGTFGVNMWATYNNPGAATNPVAVPAAGTNQNGQHWLQVIQDNWNITPGQTNGIGKPENVVDVPYPGGTQQADPYYDVGFAATDGAGGYFFDAPRRQTAPLTGQAIYWTAEDFIVNQTAAYNPIGNVKGAITVYGGIVYGFQASTPEPGTIAYGLVLLGSSVGLLRRRRAKR